MSLRAKLLSGFFAGIIIPLFLVGTVAFFVSQHMIEKKYSELNEVTLKSVATNIDNVTKEVNHLSVAAVANPTVQEILSLDTTHMTQTELDLHTIEAENTLRKILYTYPFVYSVILYDTNGIPYRVGQYDDATIPYDKLTRHDVYKEVLEQDGLPVWIGPYQYPDLAGNSPVLTQIRLVKDVDTLENKGTLILQSNLDSIGGIFNKFTSDNRFLFVDNNGLIFFDTSHDLQGGVLHDEIDQPITLSSEYETFKRGFNGNESLVSVYGLSLKNWRILSVRSWHSLSKEVGTIVKWITIITAVCVIGALLVNMLFVNRTTQKITDVVRLMKRVEEGELDVRAKEEGSGETRSLTTGFNSLIARIHHLLEEVKREQERKKKAEMMLLEAQIQPHFLFNTLESINGLAVQNNGGKVSRMIQQLGQILRISMESAEEIPIRQEIKHLESYLAIQKYRFEELFDYELDIPAHLLNHTVLKLTLQPLVENAIQHGFDGLDRKGKIKVRAYDDDDKIAFFVKDNGKGIPEHVLQDLWKGRAVSEKEQKGLGITNVADRILIHYGKSYGLFICSSESEGTIIKCVIPK